MNLCLSRNLGILKYVKRKTKDNFQDQCFVYIYTTQQRDIYDTVIFRFLQNLLRTDNETKSVKIIYN